MTPSKPTTDPKDDDQAVTEVTADFPGLIDLVVDEQDYQRVKFWCMGPKGKPHCTASVEPSKTSVLVPPPRDALPWLLPRRREVVGYFKTDTNEAYFRALVEWIETYADLAAGYAVLLAAWIVHTYFVDLIHASPYVVFTGPPETGKTRVVVAAIHAARRGILTMTPREAALIRYASDYRATVALDTIDFMGCIREMADFFAARTTNDGAVTTRILDFKKGRFAGIEHYTAYGATLVASNTPIADDIIASRSLVMPVYQSSRTFRACATPQLALPLRERGTAFRARVMRLQRKGKLPAPPELGSRRLGEILSGLALAVTLTDPSFLPTLERLAVTFAAARRTEVQDTFEVELLRRAIAELEGVGAEVVEMKLVDFVKNANGDRRETGEKLLTSRRVSGTLRTTLGLKVESGTGNYSYVTFRRDQLADLATRYGLQGPTGVKDVNNPSASEAHVNAPLATELPVVPKGPRAPR